MYDIQIMHIIHDMYYLRPKNLKHSTRNLKHSTRYYDLDSLVLNKRHHFLNVTHHYSACATHAHFCEYFHNFKCLILDIRYEYVIIR